MATFFKSLGLLEQRLRDKVTTRMQQAADHSLDNVTINNHSLGKTGETYKRYKFNTRKQKARETVDDYISALCTLASTCNFCDCLKDSLLRDRIVLGIKDSSTRKRLLKEADLNLETCIAMCRAAETEAASPSQPVKTVTQTEATTAVQAGSVSSGDQRPGKKQDFSISLRRCDQMPSPDEVEMSEVNTELDNPDDDSALQWTTEHQSSGVPWDRTKHNKQEPARSMEEDSPDQPSAVHSTVQPMSDNTSGSLLSLNTSRVCQHCSTAFVLVSSLELHLASVHGEFTLDLVLRGSSKPDRCEAGNCDNTGIDKEADTDGKRKRRRKKKADDNDTSDKDGKNRSEQHVCDVCTKSFSYLSKLKRHKLIHSDFKPFVCDMCGKRFINASHLKMHKLTHSNRKPFACDVCDKSFVSAAYLKAHKMVHSSNDKPYLCDVCSKGFTRASDLKAHKKIHTGERPFKCPHCDSDFTRPSQLQHHIKSVHEGARPHLCDVCGAAFSQTSSLAVHRRIHTGEKPYKCSHCGKGFATLSSFTRHCLTHTGEKPYKCSDCGKAFARSSTLARHHLTHSGQKPYMCSNCGKGFADSGTLNRHRLIHYGKKPHSCPQCPSAFKSPQQLKKHVENTHQ